MRYPPEKLRTNPGGWQSPGHRRSPLRRASPLKQALWLNGVILVLLILSRVAPVAAFLGGLGIIAVLAVLTVFSPQTALYLLFGSKLTFDMLWNLELGTSLLPYSLLELMLLPALLLLLGLRPIGRSESRLVLAAAVGYLAWVVLATLANAQPLSLPLLVRQSGLVLGLIWGAGYVRHPRQLTTLVYLLLVSTLVPVLITSLQVALSQVGVSIFYFTQDTVRGSRPAGPYYDAATAGMVSITSLLCNVFLLSCGAIARRHRRWHLLLLVMTAFNLVASGTRSVIIVGAVIAVPFLFRSLRQALAVVAVAGAIAWAGTPYLDAVYEKSLRDVRSDVDASQLLQDDEYGTLLTGRVSLWQDVWRQSSRSTLVQQLLGSGRCSNAHSTYFFLLLQVGWLGLAYYLAVSLFAARVVWRSCPDRGAGALALAALGCFLALGLSMTTVSYTSFQWLVYLLVGGALGLHERRLGRRPLRYGSPLAVNGSDGTA